MKKTESFDEHFLLDILRNAGRPLRLDDILRIGALSRRLKRGILSALHGLAHSGELIRLDGGAWAVADAMKTRRGRLSIQRSGAAFVTPEGATARTGQDIYVAPEYIGDAWNGDLVDVILLPVKRGPGKGPEGRVLSVARRGQTEIVARVLREGSAEHTALCRPADSRLTFDVLVDISGLEKKPEEYELLNITMGEKLDESGRRILWSGKALASLGVENDAAVQERLTKLNNSIPLEFPDNVVAEAEAAANAPAAGGEQLTDLRGEMLVTIDGEDARDFDDAVYACRKGEGWRLLVAIADVSHYVRPRTALDREARARGNSYYFPMSVEPMLPEVLCNGVCSLRPNEERRCMAADMTLDANGHLVEARFINGVMISRARLTYNEVQSALDDPQGKAAADIERRAPGVCAMLEEAARLADVLMERRHRQGALDFDLPEAEFMVEEKGGISRVTGIRNRERLFSHRLIEAFMVRANEAVAEFLTRKNAPFLYRVHPAPGPDKLEDLYRALRAADAELPLPRESKVPVPNWLTHVLDAAAGTDQAFIVNRLTLRSMMQARYSPEEDGHFGLASACYCHFTSPIRRYADLVNHRALRYALGLDTGGTIPAGHKLLEVAELCNGRERVATDAEREIGRRMGCLLLQGRTGDIFGGVISGVMNFGFFVELDGMPVEGMVRVETLGRDYYVFDEDRQELRGERNGESFRLGQRVTVKLAGVHVGRLEIDLEYRNDEEERRPFRRRNADRSPRRARFDEKGGRDERRGGGARKSFRMHQEDDELQRQRRYASENWGGEEHGTEEGRSFRPKEERSFRGRRSHSFHGDEGRRPRAFSRDDREKRPFRDHGFRPRENEGRPWKDEAGKRHAEFQSEQNFPRKKRPFEQEGRRFHDEERRPFRHEEERRQFRSARPRFEDDRSPRREGDRERSFRSTRESGTGYRREKRRFDEEGHGSNFHDRPGRGNFRSRHADEDRVSRSFSRPERPRRDREGHEKFHGAPDDFFAIQTESRAPEHRFGKRRK